MRLRLVVLPDAEGAVEGRQHPLRELLPEVAAEALASEKMCQVQKGVRSAQKMRAGLQVPICSIGTLWLRTLWLYSLELYSHKALKLARLPGRRGALALASILCAAIHAATDGLPDQQASLTWRGRAGSGRVLARS